MSVYVDTTANPFGRMVMCHMIADTPGELRAMVVRIGVDAKWFQGKASTPHFDVAKSKKALAVQAGAVELDRRAFVGVMKRIRQTWPNNNGVWLLP
jgi:hypothetical protein